MPESGHEPAKTPQEHMSNPSPSNRLPSENRMPAWLPSRRALLAVAIAFAAGLLLFLALWLDIRDNNDFYRTAEAPRSLEGQVFAPLPVPTPAGEEGHLEARDGDGSDAQPTAAMPPPPMNGPVEAAPVAPPMPAAPVAAAAADSAPRLLSSPAPRYPRNAQRRGIGGTVLLRVHVGTDGKPEDIDLIEGSGSHDLDRAAAEAVRRWRFAPAMRGGQPVEAAVQVPITFNLK
jgi:protein TonB